MLKVVFFAATENDLISLSGATKRLRQEKGSVVSVQARSRRDLSQSAKWEEFRETALQADIVIFLLHGGKDSCPGFEELMTGLRGKVKIHIQPTSAETILITQEYATISQALQQEITLYIRNGGQDNYHNLLLFLSNQLIDTDFPVQAPKALPWEGIYHPDMVGSPALEEYLERNYVPGRPTIGIWFHRSYWVDGNTVYIDALIREFESQNVNVLPVFMQATKDVDLGNLGVDGVINNFFLEDGRPVVDVVINLMMFSVTMKTDQMEIIPREDKGVLEKLGVPVIRGLTTTTTKEEWHTSLQGLSPMDVSIGVALPEFDGALITWPVAAREITKHVQEDVSERVDDGFDLERAREEACYRIFGCKPGAYGAGVSVLIDSQNWQDTQDIAQVYVTWGGYAYGKKQYGAVVPELFQHRLSQLDIAVKNEDNREYDMMDSDDFYSYHGGMIAAVRAIKGENPKAYIGDSSDPERVKTRSTQEEARHVFRARMLNPKWIQSMHRHGYKGAADISRAVDIAFGWDATAEVMEDWMYDELAQKYVLDKEMQEWLKDVNPYALQNIIERLLEAIKRGMWEAGPQIQEELRDIYLDIEGQLEESQAQAIEKVIP